MLKVAITGSIASGKSYVAKLIEQQNYPVFYSDKFVFGLYQQPNFMAQVAEILPSLVSYRKEHIADHIFNNMADKTKLEQLIHPLVTKNLNEFFIDSQFKNKQYCFAEIPLLFETNMQKIFDYVINVSCPNELRLQRALKRPFLTTAKFYKIINTQFPDADKSRLADYVLLSTNSKLDLASEIKNLFKKLAEYARNNP